MCRKPQPHQITRAELHKERLCLNDHSCDLYKKCDDFIRMLNAANRIYRIKDERIKLQ
jgi:hypothetical protein